ncbi:uncharacterized sodium-dependent transporter YhdH-like [Amphiura filiformis]|uniref:uncharacterized sodium-dependent transporter YhdH-like n=1 Tax=Amphiura filiformis TaxID=82378 RepID=UPI003B20E7F3
MADEKNDNFGMSGAAESAELTPKDHKDDNPEGTFSSKIGLILSCIGCMVGTGNIWRFPRILANNSGDSGCLQFLLVWLVFLFVWSIPMIMIEYGTGRFTKKSTILSFQKLIGPNNIWGGMWIGLVDLGITCYYSVIVGWCMYYFFYYLINSLPTGYDQSQQIFDSFYQDSAWPVACHGAAVVLGALSVAWGVKSIELVNSIVVPIFLVLLLFTFIWSLTLEYASEGLKFMFSPDWDKLSNPRLWVDAISQNAFDTGAALGLFVPYATYMTSQHGIIRYAIFVPIGNNIISLVCGMLTFSTVFATQMQNGTNVSEIVDLLKENGPANTGLTFIWMPILYNEIKGGQVLTVFFFISLVLAGLSSMVANIELFVHNVGDFGVNRKLATLVCCTIVFLFGLGSALNINFLLNQDFVWGFALLISGLVFQYMVIRYGPTRFRMQLYNDYSIDDWTLPKVWEWIIMFVAPIEAVALIIWWAVDTISNDSDEYPWYGFSPESFMATVFEWGAFMIVLLLTNVFYVKIFLPRRPDLQRSDVMPTPTPFVSDEGKEDYATFQNDMETTIDRESALTESSKSSSNRVPLVLTYHPHTIPIRNIIRRQFKILQESEDTCDIFDEPPVTAFKKDRNISDHLVRASHPLPPVSDEPGTFSCKRKRCNTCPYVSLDLTHIEGPHGTFDITSHFTCVTTNVVYVIMCTRCKKLYIGETCRRLADRFTEHLRSIRINLDGFPVARHFNHPSMCTIADIKVGGVIASRGSNQDRLAAENRLIFKLGTLQPQGLNTKFEMFNL